MQFDTASQNKNNIITIWLSYIHYKSDNRIFDQMDKKIFYGEYTLLHWIELMLRKNIVLPAYQRHFAWEDDQVKRFIKALKNGNFIPPIVIGAYHDDNIIIDGQQRLTSILLGYLGLLPRRDQFHITDDPNYADANEGVAADEMDPNEPIKWTFKIFTESEHGSSKAEILGNIDNTKYLRLTPDETLDEAMLNNTYLGFSYIVPETTNDVIQQKFYSTVFHDINLQGVSLQMQESRRSLYYLNSSLTPFFEPNLHRMLKVTQNGKTTMYDFVRALAFTSQFAKQTNEHSIAKNCRSQEQLETYYENYINGVVLDTDSPTFGKFSTMVSVPNITPRTSRLQTYITALGYNAIFSTIIDADTHLIGLIYHVLIKGRELDDTRYDALKTELADKVNTFKQNSNHRNSPNGVTYLRQRIRNSIDIYQRYIL